MTALWLTIVVGLSAFAGVVLAQDTRTTPAFRAYLEEEARRDREEWEQRNRDRSAQVRREIDTSNQTIQRGYDRIIADQEAREQRQRQDAERRDIDRRLREIETDIWSLSIGRR